MMHKIGLAMLALAFGCAVDASPELEPASEAPPASVPPVLTPAEPASEHPACRPEELITVGGDLIIVPGYCARRELERPTVGDPDPSGFGLPEEADIK